MACTSDINSRLDKGTSMDADILESSQRCKYCSFRLSKLKILDRSKSSVTERINELYPTESLKKHLVDKSCQTSASLFEKAEMTQKELRSLALILRYRNGKTLKCDTFCDCVLQGKEKDCRCGETEKAFDWTWDKHNRSSATYLQEDNRQVIFHKDYSCGTAAIRGDSPMDFDQYFWEIKMTSPVYGTDMMIGVGTKIVELCQNPNSFCSMIGSDLESWGISYDGRVQHGGKKREYSSRFGQGAIIGVHLDMWHGTLAYFKNRHSLGIAFSGLKGRILYPMACSTAARSSMKVISCRSFPSSLQYLCCRRLRQFVPAHLSVLKALAMPPGLRGFLSNNMTWLLSEPQTNEPVQSSDNYICSICLPLKHILETCAEEEDSDEESLINHSSLHLADSDEDYYEEYGSMSDMLDTEALPSSSDRNAATSPKPSCSMSSSEQCIMPSPTKKIKVDKSKRTFSTDVGDSCSNEDTLDSKQEILNDEALNEKTDSNLLPSENLLLGKRKH